ncbi:MAG TPA: hypothetical protein VMV93_10985 [Chloroflexota bacterium]|nr:hypothetical protein [Chloroflexota bacterium]
MLGATQFQTDHNPRTPRYLPLTYYLGVPARHARRLSPRAVALLLSLPILAGLLLLLHP